MDFIEICKPFEALTVNELYNILKLRSQVFVVEQKCIFLDADDQDQFCQHLMLVKNKELVAYARIVPPGISYTEASIGRVISNADYRGQGFGVELMKLAIQNCIRLHGVHPIKIGAQLYLKNFYESFGFKIVGDIYDEDGIDHIHMIKAR